MIFRFVILAVLVAVSIEAYRGRGRGVEEGFSGEFFSSGSNSATAGDDLSLGKRLKSFSETGSLTYGPAYYYNDRVIDLGKYRSEGQSSVYGKAHGGALYGKIHGGIGKGGVFFGGGYRSPFDLPFGGSTGVAFHGPHEFLSSFERGPKLHSGLGEPWDELLDAHQYGRYGVTKWHGKPIGNFASGGHLAGTAGPIGIHGGFVEESGYIRGSSNLAGNIGAPGNGVNYGSAHGSSVTTARPIGNFGPGGHLAGTAGPIGIHGDFVQGSGYVHGGSNLAGNIGAPGNGVNYGSAHGSSVTTVRPIGNFGPGGHLAGSGYVRGGSNLAGNIGAPGNGGNYGSAHGFSGTTARPIGIFGPGGPVAGTAGALGIHDNIVEGSGYVHGGSNLVGNFGGQGKEVNYGSAHGSSVTTARPIGSFGPGGHLAGTTGAIGSSLAGNIGGAGNGVNYGSAHGSSVTTARPIGNFGAGGHLAGTAGPIGIHSNFVEGSGYVHGGSNLAGNIGGPGNGVNYGSAHGSSVTTAIPIGNFGAGGHLAGTAGAIGMHSDFVEGSGHVHGISSLAGNIGGPDNRVNYGSAHGSSVTTAKPIGNFGPGGHLAGTGGAIGVHGEFVEGSGYVRGGSHLAGNIGGPGSGVNFGTAHGSTVTTGAFTGAHAAGGIGLAGAEFGSGLNVGIGGPHGTSFEGTGLTAVSKTKPVQSAVAYHGEGSGVAIGSFETGSAGNLKPGQNGPENGGSSGFAGSIEIGITGPNKELESDFGGIHSAASHGLNTGTNFNSNSGGLGGGFEINTGAKTGAATGTFGVGLGSGFESNIEGIEQGGRPRPNIASVGHIRQNFEGYGLNGESNVKQEQNRGEYGGVSSIMSGGVSGIGILGSTKKLESAFNDVQTTLNPIITTGTSFDRNTGGSEGGFQLHAVGGAGQENIRGSGLESGHLNIDLTRPLKNFESDLREIQGVGTPLGGHIGGLGAQLGVHASAAKSASTNIAGLNKDSFERNIALAGGELGSGLNFGIGGAIGGPGLIEGPGLIGGPGLMGGLSLKSKQKEADVISTGVSESGIADTYGKLESSFLDTLNAANHGTNEENIGVAGLGGIITGGSGLLGELNINLGQKQITEAHKKLEAGLGDIKVPNNIKTNAIKSVSVSGLGIGSSLTGNVGGFGLGGTVIPGLNNGIGGSGATFGESGLLEGFNLIPGQIGINQVGGSTLGDNRGLLDFGISAPYGSGFGGIQGSVIDGINSGTSLEGITGGVGTGLGLNSELGGFGAGSGLQGNIGGFGLGTTEIPELNFGNGGTISTNIGGSGLLSALSLKPVQNGSVNGVSSSLGNGGALEIAIAGPTKNLKIGSKGMDAVLDGGRTHNKHHGKNGDKKKELCESLDQNINIRSDGINACKNGNNDGVNAIGGFDSQGELGIGGLGLTGLEGGLLSGTVDTNIGIGGDQGVLDGQLGLGGIGASGWQGGVDLNAGSGILNGVLEGGFENLGGFRGFQGDLLGGLAESGLHGEIGLNTASGELKSISVDGNGSQGENEGSVVQSGISVDQIQSKGQGGRSETKLQGEVNGGSISSYGGSNKLHKYTSVEPTSTAAPSSSDDFKAKHRQ